MHMVNGAVACRVQPLGQAGRLRLLQSNCASAAVDVFLRSLTMDVVFQLERLGRLEFFQYPGANQFRVSQSLCIC
jgi:hypothetical protein